MPHDPEQIGTDTPEEIAAKVEQLLGRIEDEAGLLPSQMRRCRDTWAYLAERAPLLQVPYLSSVLIHGQALFTPGAFEQGQLDREVQYPTVRCPGCGNDIPGVIPQRRSGRMVVNMTCDGCGIEVAQFDGEGYPGETLRSVGLN